jgi:hypothetical protein
MSRLATPSGLTDASEYPAVQLPDPSWTENYCFVCYDPATEIGLWSHLARAPFDHTLWRELSMIYLPGGDRLVNKSYGRTETDRGPGGASLSYQCLEAWNSWRMRRDGAVARHTEAELDSATATDRAQERAIFDLEATGRAPVWDWGEVEDEHGWGKLHYEQLCHVTGTLTLAGAEIAFDGAGLRDHTRGPRDFTVFQKHIWAWANFPDGRGFILLQLLVGGQELTRAAAFDGERLEATTLHNRPLLDSRANGRDPYVLELGERRIEAELLHTLPNGFAGANDICIGYDPRLVQAANFESFTRFTWDGEVGFGLTQRAIKER